MQIAADIPARNVVWVVSCLTSSRDIMQMIIAVVSIMSMIAADDVIGGLVSTPTSSDETVA